jgi:hypothetical protein
MMHLAPACLATLLIVVPSMASGQQPCASSTSAVTVARVFDVCFDGEVWQVAPPRGVRITSHDEVWIRIRRFNFLRYSLGLDVQEERAESYAYLADLWSSVLRPPPLDILGGAIAEAAPAAPDPFVEAARLVYARSQDVQRRIEAAIAPHTRTGLAPAELEALAIARDEVRGATEALRAAFSALQQLVERDTDAFKRAFAGSTKAYYALAADSYEKAMARSASFQSLAGRTLGDEIRRLGTRSAGTRVTVTLAATDPAGVHADIGTIHYVSQSRMPLVLHGGLAATGVDDVAFSGFLGWQLFAARTSLDADTKQQPFGVLLSIGIDLAEPDRRLYLAPSAMLFGRLLVTSGAAFGERPVGRNAGGPDVLRAVTDSGTTSWFAAITVRLY